MREGLNRHSRRRLTDKEWNTVSHYTRKSKLDSVFDIAPLPGGFEDDVFVDFEEDRYISLKEGFELLKESAVYPLTDVGISKEEENIITALINEFAS